MKNQFVKIFILKVFTLILAIIPLLLAAQDKIRFADGKELACKVEGVTDSTVWVTKTKGKRTKEVIFPNYDIFSVVYGDSIEFIIYKPDPSDSKAFNLDQMRSYVAGAGFAQRNYKGFVSTSGAFVAGVGGGLLGFWGLLVPLIYDLGVGSYAPFPKNFRKEKCPEAYDDFFIIGYQDVAQKRKTHRIIVTSITGVIAIAVYTTLMTK